MIIGFIGTVGSGKTLGMTREGYKYYLQGLKVYSNYRLSFPHELLTAKKFNELIEDNDKLQNCVLMLDELHVWIDARSSSKSRQKAITYFILQTRKRNVRLLYSTQHFEQVDKRLRKTTDILVYCENMTNKTSLVSSERVVLRQDFFMQYGKSPPRSFVYVANPWYVLYDTTEIVDFTNLE